MGEIDLHPTFSSTDPPGLPLVISMGFVPYNGSALPGNPPSVWPRPPGNREITTPHLPPQTRPSPPPHLWRDAQWLPPSTP